MARCFGFRAGAGDTFTYEALRLLDPLVEGTPTNTVLAQGADGLITATPSAAAPPTRAPSSGSILLASGSAVEPHRVHRASIRSPT